jgi:hypothetical protein
MCLERWLRMPTLTDDEIGKAIAAISKLQTNGGWTRLDLLLHNASMADMNVVMMVSLLRATYNIRNRLAYWDNFLLRARSEVQRRNRNPDSVFRGLSCDQE